MGKPFNHSQTDILFWNARGIKSKKCEFLNYLEANNIPVSLVTETHLRPATKFKCSSYVTCRSERSNERDGGTAMLIRQDLKHSETLHPQLQRMEATAIQISINKRIRNVNFYLQSSRQDHTPNWM
jgi:exonuclease III